MDSMNVDFDYAKLKWDNPSYEKWDEECPLRDEVKKSELVEIKAEVIKPPFSAQEIIGFGIKPGPVLGQINKAIVGKSKEEALEIIKQISGMDLKLESVKWIKTFEQFRTLKK